MTELGHQNTEKYQHRSKKKNILHGKVHTILKIYSQNYYIHCTIQDKHTMLNFQVTYSTQLLKKHNQLQKYIVCIKLFRISIQK